MLQNLCKKRRVVQKAKKIRNEIHNTRTFRKRVAVSHDPYVEIVLKTVTKNCSPPPSVEGKLNHDRLFPTRTDRGQTYGPAIPAWPVQNRSQGFPRDIPKDGVRDFLGISITCQKNIAKTRFYRQKVRDIPRDFVVGQPTTLGISLGCPSGALGISLGYPCSAASIYHNES